MAFNDATPSYLHRALTRPATILTASFVAHDIDENLGEFNQIALEIDLTLGSLTSLEIKIETGDNFQDLYETVNVTESSGITTVDAKIFKLSASGKVVIPFQIITRKLRISVRGEGGTPTGSSLAFNTLIGVK